MADIFVSYSKRDGARAETIVAALGVCGFEVWWDRLLPAHSAYSEEIARQHAAAAAVLALWSSESVSSQWVRSEADNARMEGRLVQARLDQARLPMPFDQVQCVDLSAWNGDHRDPELASICAAAEALRSGGAAVPQERVAPAARPARSWANPKWYWPAIMALLPVIAALAGLGPPDGEIQTAILAVIGGGLFFLVAAMLKNATHRRAVIVVSLAALVAFGAAVAYNLGAQRFIDRGANGERVVLGCNWRSDAQATIAAAKDAGELAALETESQCPGDFPMASEAVGGTARALYTSQSIELVWLLLSMMWGAFFTALPIAAAAGIRLQRG